MVFVPGAIHKKINPFHCMFLVLLEGKHIDLQNCVIKCFETETRLTKWSQLMHQSLLPQSSIRDCNIENETLQ